jgi:hypothetical protein
VAALPTPHKAIIEALRTGPTAQLLLIGDSITHNYERPDPRDENFQPFWKKQYELRRAVNLGLPALSRV